MSDTEYAGEQIDAQDISPGDRILIERASYYSSRDEWSYARYLFDVTEEIAGGWEAVPVPADEHEAATEDEPPISMSDQPDEVRLSQMEELVAVYTHDTSDVFKGTCEWRHWKTCDRIFHVA